MLANKLQEMLLEFKDISSRVEKKYAKDSGRSGQRVTGKYAGQKSTVYAEAYHQIYRCGCDPHTLIVLLYCTCSGSKIRLLTLNIFLQEQRLFLLPHEMKKKSFNNISICFGSVIKTKCIFFLEFLCPIKCEL